MLSDAEKDFRAGIWYSIVSLERILTVMTGRPSMVKDEDCSVTLPLIESEKGNSRNPLEVRTTFAAVAGPPNANYSNQILRRAEKTSDLSPDVPHPEAYFSYYAQLHAISQLVADELYHPAIRNAKWSDIQRKIQSLDEKLLDWAARLPDVFDIQAPSSTSANESFRVALGILFGSTRMIINRPCLGGTDCKISNQSDASRDASRVGADQCVISAKAVLGFVSDEENLHRILAGPLWWMLPHHLKRATTVLLLDLAYRLPDKASEVGKVLDFARNAVDWLQKLAPFGEASHKSWVTLSHLLRLITEKIGRGTFDSHHSFDSNLTTQHSTEESTDGQGGIGPTPFPDALSMWEQQNDYHQGFYYPGTVSSAI
jgi:hypothetical protein